MNTHDAIRYNLDSSQFVLNKYLEDFTDADLLVRPVPGTNHTAWQLGHLICSEHQFINALKEGTAPKLPVGFEGAHAKDCAQSDDKSKFLTKKEYLEAYAAQRRAALELLETYSAEDFDKPGPEKMRSYCPTIGSVFILLANHTLMHAGQLVAVRRKLQKPIVM